MSRERKYGYVQAFVDEFNNSLDPITVVPIPEGTYSNPNSARCAYRNAIKTLGCDMVVRMIHGDLYLIKIQNPNWTIKHFNGECYACGNRYPSRECSTCINLSNFTFAEREYDNASMA